MNKNASSRPWTSWVATVAKTIHTATPCAQITEPAEYATYIFLRALTYRNSLFLRFEPVIFRVAQKKESHGFIHHLSTKKKAAREGRPAHGDLLNPTLPYFTSPCFALPRRAIPCLALACRALPCLAVPASTCLASNIWGPLGMYLVYPIFGFRQGECYSQILLLGSVIPAPLNCFLK